MMKMMTNISFLVLLLIFSQFHPLLIASTSALQEHPHVQKAEPGAHDGIQIKASGGARGGGGIGGGARGGIGGGSRGGIGGGSRGGGRSGGGGEGEGGGGNPGRGSNRGRGRGSRLPFYGAAAGGAAAAAAHSRHHGSACPTAHFSSTLPLFLLALGIYFIRC